MAATMHVPTAGSSNRLRTIPSASRMPARSWTQMSSAAAQPKPEAMAAYYLQPLNGQVLPARCRSSVVTGATGSCEGGDPVVTILGATGLVGQELLRLIPRAWPNAKLQLFASRDKTMEVDGKTYAVKAAEGLEAADAPKGDLAMVALDDDYSRRYVPRLLELGYRVIDKSNCYRMDPNVPLGGGPASAQVRPQGGDRVILPGYQRRGYRPPGHVPGEMCSRLFSAKSYRHTVQRSGICRKCRP